MAKKKVKVDASSCIGCGGCIGSYPDDFQFNADGLAEPINGEAEEGAASVCPVGAISEEE